MADQHLPISADHDPLVNRSPRARPLAELIEARLSRREVLQGLALAAGWTASGIGAPRAAEAASSTGSSFAFQEVEHGADENLHVPPGYEARVLIRWGDSVLSEAPVFEPLKQTAVAQEQQFGYNNDFIAYMPLPRGSNSSTHGLLCVNHEYVCVNLMFPRAGGLLAERVQVEMAAHGHSIIEIQQRDGQWHVVPNSRYARRLSGRSTEMAISGPAAAHARLKTSADPAGNRVIGTLNNCAGGVTPWGTVLVAEENFNVYFAGDPRDSGEQRNCKRMEIGLIAPYVWSKFVKRFDVGQEPHEPNRFGWIVEYDPYDPASTPVKRTALGRFKHEGATAAVSHDRRVAIYSGDDSKFEYLYRFVSRSAWSAEDRSANRDLLDEGTLCAARFHDDGTADWLPLVFGSGPLVAVNGFHSQADVLIETRHAAQLLGATPLDRPEDVETNPLDGRVYVMLTNNLERTMADAANPRAHNRHGHIIELIPPGEAGAVDHTAEKYRWEILLLAGNPAQPADGARYHPDVSANGWLSSPDNCTFDPKGRMWVATDGAYLNSQMADGMYACDTTGAARALTRFFFRAPRGAEMCGPCFTPDGRTLFVAVQHPADEAQSTFEQPSTRWPDFDPALPPRPSVVAITRADGGEIGD